ncbi:MAG TPA: DUF2652 domain-containing protein [Candidatus Limnocylindrales bacterium]|nr:DUF2652 domain-containing protein [Candidatus Limnocylindrales bacterium]
MKPVERSCLLIADISGYTAYLAGVELDHAQDILADLIGTVVTTLRPTFRLAKLEGDAAFMAAPEGETDGSLLLDTIERCYFGFRRRRRDVRQATSCECDACMRIPDLNLKFVVHTGPVVRQDMAGLEELIGRDVIVVHRLLKNTVAEETGATAYALLTDACTTAMDLRPAALQMTPHTETYEVVGEIHGWVHDLERRWQEEDERARVFVRPEDTFLSTSYEVAAPPAIVWEYLTTPGRRVEWMAGVTDVIQDATGNRRAVGATNHCMHGKDAIVEEVLDWRPFDYFTIRSIVQTPGGPVGIPNTFELTPTSTGTRVSLRFERLTNPAELAIVEPMAPMFQGMVDAGAAALRTLLGTEMQTRGATAPPEPQLPTPRKDGEFADLPPITYLA